MREMIKNHDVERWSGIRSLETVVNQLKLYISVPSRPQAARTVTKITEINDFNMIAELT